jgi:hypothetical protein
MSNNNKNNDNNNIAIILATRNSSRLLSNKTPTIYDARLRIVKKNLNAGIISGSVILS